MNVLFVRTDQYGAATDGGSFSMQKGMLAGLRNCGHNVEVVTSCPLPVPDGMRVHTIDFSPLYNNLPEVISIPHNWKVKKEVRGIIERFKPDFIYQRHSGFNITGALIQRELGIPYVLQFDGSEVWMKKNWGKLYFEKLLTWAEDIALQHATAITVVSKVMKKTVVQLGVDERKVFVVPNGVDPQRFSPTVDGTWVREKYNLGGKKICGFVGTFGQWHGVTVLAEAVNQVIKQDPSIHFLFVGDGGLRKKVEEILGQDNVRQYTTITGLVKHDEVPAHVAACDVVTSPTVHNPDGTEFFGSPTKLFEYMAMQKPIIVSPVGQIADVITDGVNGVYAKENNPQDLAEKILTVMNNPTLKTTISNGARYDAETKYDWNVHAESIVSAFRKGLEVL
ncbi:MAG: glycosyltransferase family 4 protein [Bacteriodetes bacterium]|nr:glycosyltransferase family 4 protein [Bacteroidota bacterium]